MEKVRFYGSSPYSAAVVHGGPGAPGEMAPVARELSLSRGVLEPLQSEDSLEGQVVELAEVLREYGENPLVLIGHSWGAMLSFITAARYPDLVKKLILVGSSVYREEYAAGIMPERMSRLGEEDRKELISLMERFDTPEVEKPDSMMARFGELTMKADSFDLMTHESEGLEFDADINLKVSGQAGELRRSGGLISLGRNITCPVVAIHGDYDPHPAEGIRKPLSGLLDEFRFISLEKCGHYPWYERHARDSFYRLLHAEL